MNLLFQTILLQSLIAACILCIAMARNPDLDDFGNDDFMWFGWISLGWSLQQTHLNLKNLWKSFKCVLLFHFQQIKYRPMQTIEYNSIVKDMTPLCYISVPNALWNSIKSSSILFGRSFYRSSLVYLAYWWLFNSIFLSIYIRWTFRNTSQTETGYFWSSRSCILFWTSVVGANFRFI